MTRIVAGMFEDQVQAERAIARLKAAGAQDGTVSTFVVNPPGMHHGLRLGGDEIADEQAERGDGGALKGATIGGAAGAVAGVGLATLVGPVGIAAGIGAGAFVGALAGASNAMGERPPPTTTARPGGVMVAVNAEAFDQEASIAALRDNGAKLVEVADGEWRDGDWVDFDPVQPPRDVVATSGNPNYPT
jgi:hypothetical protein